MERIDKTLADMGLGELIKSAGPSARRSIEVYKCVKCQDAGFVHPLLENGKPDYSRTIECDCRIEENKKLRIFNLMRMCELPASTEGYTFDNFKVRPEVKEAYQDALMIANGEGALKWLTLVGGVDVGKTHLAVAICRRWLLRGAPAKFAYVPLLLDELRRGYKLEGDGSYDYRFQIFCTIPLLVLDDLGAERGTDWAREKLETIIDYRAVNGLPLVVTTNLGMDELPARIASRLQRVTFGKVVLVNAREYRITRK